MMQAEYSLPTYNNLFEVNSICMVIRDMADLSDSDGTNEELLQQVRPHEYQLLQEQMRASYERAIETFMGKWTSLGEQDAAMPTDRRILESIQEVARHEQGINPDANLYIAALKLTTCGLRAPRTAFPQHFTDRVDFAFKLNPQGTCGDIPKLQQMLLGQTIQRYPRINLMILGGAEGAYRFWQRPGDRLKMPFAN